MPASDQSAVIRTVGIDGMIVTFGDVYSEAANRAAIAFRASYDPQKPAHVSETSITLCSVYVRFDPLALPHEAIRRDLQRHVDSRDWYAAPLPKGRRLWRVPTVFGTDLAPQLDEAAAAAGLTPDAARAELCAARVRVQGIGFAPGQPYLGGLPEHWNIPRQTGLTPRVPAGALVVAIRQFVLFGVSAPTGWRHVGQTAFSLFDRGGDTPFTLRHGDEVIFISSPRDSWDRLQAAPLGGATCEPVP